MPPARGVRLSVKPSLFAELRRRNVFRAALLYVGAVWALTQGIAQLTPVVGAPEWAARWFLVAAVIGFPFWVAFAWLFEFTPEGIKRESEVEPHESITHHTGRINCGQYTHRPDHSGRQLQNPPWHGRRHWKVQK